VAMITIAEVFERVDEFEQMLAAFYANLSRQTTREGVRILMDYIGRHRQRTLEELAKLPAGQMQDVYRITLRYEPQGLGKHCFEEIEISPAAAAEDVLDAVIEFDEYLIRFYRQVLQQPVDQKVKELFQSLIRKEQDDEIEMKKIKAMSYF